MSLINVRKPVMSGESDHKLKVKRRSLPFFETGLFGAG